MRWAPPVLLACLIVPMLAHGQFQPVDDPDWSAFESREDITAAGDLDGAQRILRFVQVSDAHILDDDAPYPLRQDPLDPIGPPVDAAQRPQEEYTDEVLNAMIESINGVHAEDRLDFVINTGDNIDNELENELMRFIDNWEGTVTTTGPVSELECLPDGQSESIDDDSTDVTDQCTHLPDSFENTPIAADLPWFSAFGNHDGLIQGNVPVEPSFQEIAEENGRYFLRQWEYVGMHFAAGTQCVSSTPAGQVIDDFGHGYGFAGNRLCDEDPDNDGYYSFSTRGMHFVVLDTVNDDFVTANENLAGNFVPETTIGYDVVGGYAEGSIDPVQFEWLIDEIETNSDRLVVVMSHHTVNSMFSSQTEDQCGGPNGECLDDLLTEAGYKTGPEIIEALSEHPNVVGWIGGHTHRHRIQPKVVDGAESPGFWNVESSSLIDLPQESRVVEVWVTANGTKGFFALKRLGHDYQESIDLAKTDPQGVPDAAGEAIDQDVLLWFDIPSGVALDPQPSLPRFMLVTHTTPEDENGTHGELGEPLTMSIRVEENLGRLPLDGLEVGVTIDRADDTTTSGVTRVLQGNMTSVGDGVYETTFTPESSRIHYVDVTLSDPTGTYGDVERTYSLVIHAEDEPEPKKKSPGIGIALIAGLAVAVALARR